MKNDVFNSAAKFLVPLSAVVIFVTACNNDDYSQKDRTEATHVDNAPGDSEHTQHTDTMMVNRTHVASMDSSDRTMQMNADSIAGRRMDTAKTKAKKTKGKVIILPADSKSNTAAMEVDKEGFYKNTEVLPAYPGGQRALENFFESNIVYPDAAIENSTQGIVRLTFAVDENGKVYNPVVLGSPLGDGIEEEAIRIFKKMPAWTPGKIKGKNVKTRYTLPIRFQLD